MPGDQPKVYKDRGWVICSLRRMNKVSTYISPSTSYTRLFRIFRMLYRNVFSLCAMEMSYVFPTSFEGWFRRSGGTMIECHLTSYTMDPTYMYVNLTARCALSV